jgi:hypothetical protein
MVKTTGKACPIIQNIVEENISNALHYSNANCRAAAYLNQMLDRSPRRSLPTFRSRVCGGSVNIAVIALENRNDLMRPHSSVLLLTFFSFFPVLFAQDAPVKTLSQWQLTERMPMICVAQVNSKSQPQTLSVLLPCPEYKTQEQTYTVNVPIKNEDGTTRNTTETRVRQVQVEAFSMERREIPLNEIEILDLEGNKLSEKTWISRLNKPKHVLYGQTPDLYTRAVLKDDLLILMPVEGKELPRVRIKVNGR